MSDAAGAVRIDGETGLILFLGHPTAQAGSPQRLNPKLRAVGRNWIVLPVDVPPGDVGTAADGFARARNLVGLIITVPHKAWALTRCEVVSPAADAVGAVNVIRCGGGRWQGDMLDGAGCLAALRAHGHEVRDRSALLVGAGGAGSAIAHALAGAGLSRLVVHDPDGPRVASMLARLRRHHPGCDAAPGAPDPDGHHLAINASPLGMRPDDPLPLDPDRLAAGQVVVDVVPKPEITPLLDAARSRGCAIQPGTAMLDGQMDLMVDFFTSSG